ncbi:MAG: TolC family protein [Bacteroidetes bacterium]|nr:TolC family protein [Bacteroidota bacterium]
MKTKHLLTLLLLSATLFASAAEARVFSLSEARAYALEHNRQMKAAGYATTKAEMALREAIANGLPQINANADYSNALGAKIIIRFNENMPPSEIDIKPTSNLFVNVQQLLFSSNYIVGVQMARLSKELTQLSRERTELEVLSGVTEAYYMALLTAESQRIISQNLANMQQLFEKTNALAAVGMIEQTNVDQLEVQMMALRNALASAERQHEMALNLLRLQLGLQPETELQLTDQLEQLLQSNYEAVARLQGLLLENQIEYRLIKQQERMSRKMTDLQRAAYLPTLAGYYRYTYKILKPDFDMTPNNVVGLQLNIPIFSSGVKHYKVQQALVDEKNMQNTRELLTDQLRIQEKQLRFNLNSAIEQYENQRKSVEVARRVYQNLQNKYAQGMISGLDLTTADNNYLRAESDYLNAMMQVLNAKLQLDKLNGNIK